MAGLIRLIGYNRAKSLMLWFGRKLERDQTTISVPTLILYGEHETSIINRHAPTLSVQIPNSTVQEVPDAGHASPWDNLEFFNSTIQTFLTNQTSIKAE